jgi:hypothetical protein
MLRHSIILSGLVVAGFLALGVQQGRADADVDGFDHSKLNHGVLGQAHAGGVQKPVGADADVTGFDHSKLNHGVLGAVWASPSK